MLGFPEISFWLYRKRKLFIFSCTAISFAKLKFKGLILGCLLTYFRQIGPNGPSFRERLTEK
jgi:hypothetical protein